MEGDHVILDGLVISAHLNGLQGICQRMTPMPSSTTDRVPVLLEDGTTKSVRLLNLLCETTIHGEGEYAFVTGLTSDIHALNGNLVKLRPFHEASTRGRVVAERSDGSPKTVKHANLRRPPWRPVDGMEDGTNVEVQSSSPKGEVKYYTVTRIKNTYMCNCRNWIFQRVTNTLRSCKHIKHILGTDFDEGRLAEAKTAAEAKGSSTPKRKYTH